MISEGSCDTEDWSNAENLALHDKNTFNFGILKYHTGYFIILLFFTILLFNYILLYSIEYIFYL